MENLKSPWTNQLQRVRPLHTLETDMSTDICIVGGGVSGIMTAYYVLKYTKHSVAIIDSYIVAHGATGHNAGQLVAELERSTASMVEEFGLEKVIEGLRSIDSAWIMLEEIIRDTNCTVPYSTFVGYDVYSTEKQVHNQLADLALAHEGGLHNRKMYISAEHVSSLHIPDTYAPYYEIVPHTSILSLADTKDTAYIAAYPVRKGCLNSAVFTEQLVSFLIETYGIGRVHVYEQTPVTEICVHAHLAEIHTKNQKKITAKKVVLCTNGFEHFKIINKETDLDMRFHKYVKGNIGYMMGLTETVGKNPSATAYLEPEYDTDTGHADSNRDILYAHEYVYVTRRPYDLNSEQPKNLFCLGGKGLPIEDTSSYSKEHGYHTDIRTEYEKFMSNTFNPNPLDDTIPHQEKFFWHGLMGYTADGIRLVGFEPTAHALMYNLGCNGIGIMPAIWGGKRIANLLNGDTTKSLFDPRHM